MLEESLSTYGYSLMQNVGRNLQGMLPPCEQRGQLSFAVSNLMVEVVVDGKMVVDGKSSSSGSSSSTEDVIVIVVDFKLE